MKHTIMRIITYCLLLSIPTHLFSHGFVGTMLVLTPNGQKTINELSKHAGYDKPILYSCDTEALLPTTIPTPATGGGKSQSSCIVHIYCKGFENDPIICTPTQEFYCCDTHRWVPAYQLTGAMPLYGYNNIMHYVTNIEWLWTTTDVYTIEVHKTHNFFIGKPKLLTHNMVLPEMVSAGPALSYISATATQAFGGITVIGAAFLGFIAGIAIKKVWGWYRVNYTIPNATDKDMHCMHKTYHDIKNKQYSDNNNKFNNGNNDQNNNHDDNKKNNPLKRVVNTMTKAEFFKSIKDDYEYYRDNAYRLKDNGVAIIKNAYYLVWDNLHNDVEVYNKAEKHLGSLDPIKKILYKGPVSSRDLNF